MTILSKEICRFNTIPMKTSMKRVTKVETNKQPKPPAICMEHKRCQMHKAIITIPDRKLYCRAVVTKTVWYWRKNNTHFGHRTWGKSSWCWWGHFSMPMRFHRTRRCSISQCEGKSPTVWPSCEPRSYHNDFPSKTCSLGKLWLNWYGVNNHFLIGGNSCLNLKTGQEPLVGKVICPGGTCCWFHAVRWPSKYTRWYSYIHRLMLQPTASEASYCCSQSEEIKR